MSAGFGGRTNLALAQVVSEDVVDFHAALAV